MKRFFLIWSVFLAIGIVFSARVHGQGKWYKRGEKAFNEGLYEEAIELFEFAVKKEDSWLPKTGVAKSYHELREFRKAEAWYRKALTDPDAPAEVHYEFGKTLMNVGKYEEAALEFFQFSTQAPQDPRAARYFDVEIQLDRLLSDSSTHEVSFLPFNSKQSDFSPFPYRNGIMFTSARKVDLAVVHVSVVDNAPLLDLYYAEQDTSGKWKKPKPLAGDVNSKFNDGPAIFTGNDSVMVMTRNFFKKGMKKQTDARLNKLKILMARLEENENWKVDGEVPFNNNAYAVGHPSLSADGNTLYFASDMPGGYGKTDIWKSEKVDGEWTQPENLGPDINTEGAEMFPFIHEDGSLYFSSDVHFGLGSLDIFRSRPSLDGWLRPVNLGYPVNSNTDDFGIYMYPDRKHGFFSSNRTEGGGKNDDLFAFEVLIPEFECVPQQENWYCYRFFEPDTLDKASLPVIYEWDFGDGNRATGVETIHCYETTGDYEVKLNLIDTLSGFIFMNQSVRQMNIRDIEQVFIEVADTVPAGELVQLNAYKSVIEGYPNAEIKEYYWNIGGQWMTGPELVYTFPSPGDYEIMLGVVAEVPGMPEEIKSCVTRTVTALSPDAFVSWQDSLMVTRMVQRPDPEELRMLKKVDSIKQANYVLEIATNLVDSTGQVYKVQIKQSDSLLLKENRVYSAADSVQVIEQDGKFNYLVGESPDLKGIYPTYQQMRDQGFEEALVVAIRNNKIITGNDSSFYFRDPETEKVYEVSLLKGKVMDMDGNPLLAEISLEDLEAGLTIERSKTDPESGKFELKLPGGKIYGYVAEVEGYHPYSNYIDLRNPVLKGKNGDVIIQDEIKLMTMRQIIEQGIPIRLNNIFFDFDKSTLRPESRQELDRLVRLMGEYSHLDIEIMGHTDSVGTAAYNLALSDRRAKSVVRYLIMNGVNTSKMEAHGYGESRPMAPNKTPEGRQLNRRVEFRFIPKPN